MSMKGQIWHSNSIHTMKKVDTSINFISDLTKYCIVRKSWLVREALAYYRWYYNNHRPSSWQTQTQQPNGGKSNQGLNFVLFSASKDFMVSKYSINRKKKSFITRLEQQLELILSTEDFRSPFS